MCMVNTWCLIDHLNNDCWWLMMWFNPLIKEDVYDSSHYSEILIFPTDIWWWSRVCAIICNMMNPYIASIMLQRIGYFSMIIRICLPYSVDDSGVMDEVGSQLRWDIWDIRGSADTDPRGGISLLWPLCGYQPYLLLLNVDVQGLPVAICMQCSNISTGILKIEEDGSENPKFKHRL